MNTNVISLHPPVETMNVRCSCGSEWFKVPGISVAASDGHPTGYIVNDAVCMECGEPLSMPGGDAP